MKQDLQCMRTSSGHTGIHVRMKLFSLKDSNSAHLAFGRMAVETGLSSPVASSLPVIDVHGKVEVEYVAFHDMWGDSVRVHCICR